MTVSELNMEQMEQLKQNYLTEHLMETEGRCPYWGELANACDIVPDALIFDAYAATEFSTDDFY